MQVLRQNTYAASSKLGLLQELTQSCELQSANSNPRLMFRVVEPEWCKLVNTSACMDMVDLCTMMKGICIVNTEVSNLLEAST